MNVLVILDELFSSDSYLFLPAGMAIALPVSFLTKDQKKIVTGFIISLLVYVFSEVFLQFHHGYFAGMIVLFAGTAALGAAACFLVCFLF